jgi:ubiquinone/menaquinone biosynthesis C-methylase UbiE
MRSVLVLLLVAGCPKAPEPKCPQQPAPVMTAPAPVTAPKAPELDDPAVISQSRAFLDAHDKADLAAFQALAGPSFVKFQRSRFYDLKVYASDLPARVTRKMPAASRECRDEKVYRTPASAIYFGSCIVRVAAYGEMPTTTAEGWETIVWVPEGDQWKVAHWQWQRAGLEAEREDWNDIFRVSTGFKRTANQFLIDVTKGRRPGTALDVATGQGRNALYLASQKWRTTGIDISDEGLRMAKEAATAQKLKVELLQEDLDKWDFGTGKWDLVTLIYMSATPELIEKVKKSVRRGGLVVVEFFAREATKGTGIGGYEAGELAKLFGGWKIVRDEVVEDVADWGLRKTKLVRFAAEKP